MFPDMKSYLIDFIIIGLQLASLGRAALSRPLTGRSGDAALPGNWFISSDGTCGDPPDTSLSSLGAFIGFFILLLALAVLSGIFNFFSMSNIARRRKLFRNGALKQTVINAVASVVAPIIAATAFKQDDDVYTSHTFHVIVWVVLFGFRPGAVMGVMQSCAGEVGGAAAIGQMVPDALFLIVGCVVALASESGSVVPVAYGRYRVAVFVGVGFLVTHLLMLCGVYLWWRHKSPKNSKNWRDKYAVFITSGGRLLVLILGLLSIAGSAVLMIVASQMCGRLVTFIDAMCQVVQALLSVFLAGWEAKMDKGKAKEEITYQGAGGVRQSYT